MSRQTYTRKSVQTHFDGGRSAPAVNIKCHLYGPDDDAFTDDLLTTVGANHAGDGPGFLAWWRDPETWGDTDRYPSMFSCWFDAAAEEAFDYFREYAAECFPDYAAKVWQEGRSGGWAVVEGLPELDCWDAVMLARWRHFERLVAWHAEEPNAAEAIAILVAINPYDHVQCAREAEAVRLATLDAELDAWATLCGSL